MRARLSVPQKSNYENPLHIVSAQVSELGIIFVPKSVDGKSNEIPAVQELLEELKISGCVVVADANCQKKTAEAVIIEAGEYLLDIKDS